jgi:hypothetical protein
MESRNGRNGEQWLMVDDHGRKTLYQLIEVGKEVDVARAAAGLPAIVVDIALPPLPVMDNEPGSRSRSTRSRLILLNVRTATGDSANGMPLRLRSATGIGAFPD